MEIYIARARVPLLTYALIAVNALAFLAEALVGQDSAIERLGLVPLRIIKGKALYTLVTSMFLHADFLHILFNMWALFIFGRDLEMILGRARYALLYFASGLAAGLSYCFYSYYLSPLPFAPLIPAIGASGAIFGVMAAFMLFFPKRPLALFVFFFPLVAPAYAIILFMALVQTLEALALPFSPIAYTAHLGGFALGLLLGALFRAEAKREAYRGYFEWAGALHRTTNVVWPTILAAGLVAPSFTSSLLCNSS